MARVDFVIGDRYGTSCSELVTDAIERSLVGRGYRVVRNKPYAGGYITEHYGNPSAGLHAVQIELNRSLYMDEAAYERNGGFVRVQADILALMGDLFVAVSEGLAPLRAAAE